MRIEPGEKEKLRKTIERLKELRGLLASVPLDFDSSEYSRVFGILREVKALLGNLNNDISFAASVLAKEFLTDRHDLRNLDVSLKPQGAPGLDIDERTAQGERVVAELKTTTPYGATDLGAQQKATFEKDFTKLARAEAEHKYFFVTDRRTFDIVLKRYSVRLGGVTLVLLPEGLSASDFAVRLSASDGNSVAPFRPPNSESPPGGMPGAPRQADVIRQFLRDAYIEPARKAGQSVLTVQSGDVLREMGIPGIYPNVCNAMRGRKIERLAEVRILERRGGTGANFYVTYAL